MRLENRKLTVVDYLVWGGWLCTLGWFTCSTKSLYILIDHPLDEETRSDSVDYLKVCPGDSPSCRLMDLEGEKAKI